MEQFSTVLGECLGSSNVCTIRAYKTVYNKLVVNQKALSDHSSPPTREDLLNCLSETVLSERYRSPTMPFYICHRGIKILNCVYRPAQLLTVSDLRQFVSRDKKKTTDEKMWLSAVLKAKCPQLKEAAHFTNEEANAILRVSMSKTRDTLFVLLLLTTGLRIGAITGLMWSQFKSLDVHACASIPDKGQHNTRVYLNAILSDALKKHRAQNQTSQYVFEAKSRKRHLTTRRLHDIFKELCKKAGVEGPHAHPHTCRHTVAHTLLQYDNSIAHISKFLGHKTINSTAVYLASSCPAVNVPWLEVFKVAPNNNQKNKSDAAPKYNHA